ncbi:MAG: SDR family NAD(P)-dependent oxidoreductase, partial [Marinomonas sp.]
MSQDMKGKVAIVTGGSDGIGRATSEMLASRGAHVVVLARGMEKLEATRDAITAAGGSVEIHSIDLSDAEAYGALVTQIAEEHGRLDMLVNNAMSVHYAPMEKLSLKNWRKDFAVNSDAVFEGTKAAVTAMRKNASGSIVNVSSTTAIRAAAYMTSYS